MTKIDTTRYCGSGFGVVAIFKAGKSHLRNYPPKCHFNLPKPIQNAKRLRKRRKKSKRRVTLDVGKRVHRHPSWRKDGWMSIDSIGMRFGRMTVAFGSVVSQLTSTFPGSEEAEDAETQVPMKTNQSLSRWRKCSSIPMWASFLNLLTGLSLSWGRVLLRRYGSLALLALLINICGLPWNLSRRLQHLIHIYMCHFDVKLDIVGIKSGLLLSNLHAFKLKMSIFQIKTNVFPN